MVKISKLLVLILLLLAATAGSLFAIEVEGVLFADYYGDIEPSTSYDSLRGRVYYQPVFYGYLFDYALDYELSANLYYDFLGDTTGFVDPENIIREAYITMPIGDFDISIGQKTVAPGMADISSPMNVVNGEVVNKLSLDDPYEGKRADAMIHLSYYPTYEDTIEVVYVPFPRPDYEPTDPVDLTAENIDVNVLFNADPYLLGNPHSLYVTYTHFGFDYDLQLSYGNYTDQTPGFDLGDLSVDGTGDLTGNIETLYGRTYTFGAAFGTSFNGIAFVEEVALNLTEDFAGTSIGLRNSDITLNTQVTGTIWGGTMVQLSVIYQYIINFNNFSTTYTDDIDAALAEEINGYFNQPLQHVAYAIAHFRNSFLHDKLAVSLNIGYLHPSVYLAPRVGFAISDRLNISTGADIKTGDLSDKDLARGNLLDNFYVRLKYAY